MGKQPMTQAQYEALMKANEAERARIAERRKQQEEANKRALREGDKD